MDDTKSLLADHGPLQADEDERAALRALDRLLAEGQSGGLSILSTEAGGVELPETVRRLLRVIVRGLGEGQAVKVVSYQPLLSSLSISELLNVSIARAEKMLTDGSLPIADAKGEVRRVRFQDVMAYKQHREAERREGLVHLMRMSEELGLYDDDDVPGPARREQTIDASSAR